MPSKTKKKPLLKVVVDRKRWLRGKGETFSWLKSPKDGKMCCLGFVGEVCGVSIYGKRAPNNTIKGRENWPSGLLTEDAQDTYHCSTLMEINDLQEGISEKDRERQIREVGKKAGIEFSFVN